MTETPIATELTGTPRWKSARDVVAQLREGLLRPGVVA